MCDANQKRRNIPKYQRLGLVQALRFSLGMGLLLRNSRLNPDRLNLTFHRIYEELLGFFFFFFMKGRSSSEHMDFNKAQSVL